MSGTGGRRRFEGEVAFVTGAASGIGRAAALRFAAEGADVGLFDLADAEPVAREIEALGRRALVFRGDVAEEAAVREAVAATEAALGAITLGVAAAGIASAAPPGTVPLGTIELDKRFEDWRRVVDVNLHGVYLTDVALGRAMRAHGRGGSIVNLASVAAKAAMPGGAAYAASKAAVWMLTRTLALELAPFRIRVNAVGPGWTRTGLTRPLFENPELLERLRRSIPLGRTIEPEEVAHTIAFLCSEEGSYYTGQLLTPCGGISPF